MIDRDLKNVINKRLFDGKAIIVLGARQTGKTTLIKDVLKDLNLKILFLDGDDFSIREMIESANTQDLKRIIGDNEIIFIDEAQRIKNVGLKAKIIIDQLKPKQLFITGSSALELTDEMNEPLTGRKWEYYLYPVSWNEWQRHIGYIQAVQQLEQRLIYGFYPEVLNNPGDEKEILKQLISSYLYKDLLSFKGIKKPEIIVKLLKALALQVGNEVSYNELAQLIQIDKKTVQNYIDLLEKVFIIFRLNPLSRNLRKEISTRRKIYFYDNGIRNALINNYNRLEDRLDTGALWENFLISERQKFLEYNRIFANTYFWRSKNQQEIDYVEEMDGKFYAYEFKWNPRVKVKFSKFFMENYKPAEIKVINKNNFVEFVSADL